MSSKEGRTSFLGMEMQRSRNISLMITIDNDQAHGNDKRINSTNNKFLIFVVENSKQ